MSGMKNLRVGFAGTPDFAAAILVRLCDSPWAPIVVFTQPDRPAGRGRKLLASAVKTIAEDRNIPIEQPLSFKQPDALQSLQNYQLDLLVVAAYGLILPQAALDAPDLGCLNVHASLLPRWRGAAPIERALMAGDSETGVCLMHMEAGLDTGPIYAKRALKISRDSTGPALETALARLGADLLIELLPTISTAVATPQPAEGVTYARKLLPSEGEIDWSLSAITIERKLRALCPRVPVYTDVNSSDSTVRVFLLEAEAQPNGAGSAGKILSIDPRRGLEVGCGEGSLWITRLRLNRGKGLPLSIAEAVNGFRSFFEVGRVLGSGRD
jgi:methionyl-tRNA formyltransferase